MDYFQIICRICESEENLCDLTNALNESIAEQLTALTTIRIELDDPLPRCICMECVNSLSLAYAFLLRCEASEKRLQDVLKLMGEEEEEGDEDTGAEEGKEVVLETVEEYVVEEEAAVAAEEDDDFVAEDDGVEFQEIRKIEPLSESLAIFEQEREEEDEEEEDDEERIDGVQLLYETIPVKYTIEEYVEEEEEEEEEEDYGEGGVILEEMEAQEMQPSGKDKKFYCETCGIGFEKCTDLYQHIKSHGKARFQCKECDRWFSRRAHLQSHEVIHTGVRNFQCQSCPNSYKSSRNLRRHVKSAHLGEKPFVCDLCGKEFSQKTVLEAHHSTHIQERNFSCEVCQKRFKSSKLLKLHVIRHVKSTQPKQDPKPVKCDICGKIYSSKMSLRNHKQMHSDAKIACTFCGKTFKIMAHLKVHLRSHTKEQPYECSECHKKFGYETSLKTHRLVHSNERPFKCDLCDVSFRQQNHLKAHKFLHSGQKPFECAVCKKAFALRGNLTIHMRIHGGPVASPFQCRLCVGKKLNDSNALKRHLKAHPKAKVVKMGSLTVIVEEGSTEEQDQSEMIEQQEHDQQLLAAVEEGISLEELEEVPESL